MKKGKKDLPTYQRQLQNMSKRDLHTYEKRQTKKRKKTYLHTKETNEKRLEDINA